MSPERTKREKNLSRFFDWSNPEGMRFEKTEGLRWGIPEKWCFVRTVGKCSVCGLEKAAWINRQADVKLCEHCYSREMRDKL